MRRASPPTTEVAIASRKLISGLLLDELHPTFNDQALAPFLTSRGTWYASAIREAHRSGPVTVDTVGLYVSAPSVFDDLSVARSYSRSNG